MRASWLTVMAGSSLLLCTYLLWSATQIPSNYVLYPRDLLENLQGVWRGSSGDSALPPAPSQPSPSLSTPELEELEQTDPRLIAEVRHRFLYPPPPAEQPLALNNPEEKEPSKGQSQVIREILRDMRGGFFVECGALDGETRSNTLYLETELGWQGLLIEADPSNVRLMMERHRHAWVAPVCLSLKPKPTKVKFQQHFNIGRIKPSAVEKDDNARARMMSREVEVQCLPLASLVLALNRTTVDYFSLDVEGDELAVLQTIPFQQLDIRTLSVEYIHGEAGKAAMREYMEQHGYRVHSEVVALGNLANDFIFVKDSTT